MHQTNKHMLKHSLEVVVPSSHSVQPSPLKTHKTTHFQESFRFPDRSDTLHRWLSHGSW